jgi:hypothetical protein
VATLRQARQRFFVENGFAADGGYEQPWQDAMFGSVPYAVPNPPVRRAALRVHDLHHVLTGYATDWRGESLISAWELGSVGASRNAYAWVIALFGFFVGLVALPRATWRAFMRGRGSRNLYGVADIDEWLDLGLEAARRYLGVRPDGAATLGDAARFVAWASVAAVAGLVLTLGTVPLVMVAALRKLVPHGCPCKRAPSPCNGG